MRTAYCTAYCTPDSIVTISCAETVALSRVRSLADMCLEHPVLPADIRAHPDVVAFYTSILAEGEGDTLP